MKLQPTLRAIVVVTALGTVACAVTALSARLLPAQGAPGRESFLLRRGTDTIVVERYERVADTLRGTLFPKVQGRIDYTVVFGRADSVRSLLVRIFPAAGEGGAAAAPRQLLIEMRGDSAIANVEGEEQRIGTTAGAIPIMGGSIAMLQLFTHRARAAAAERSIPAFLIAGGVTAPFEVTPVGADSLVMTISGGVQRLRVDAAGRILGGTIPAQEVEIVRMAAAPR